MSDDSIGEVSVNRPENTPGLGRPANTHDIVSDRVLKATGCSSSEKYPNTVTVAKIVGQLPEAHLAIHPRGGKQKSTLAALAH